MNTSGEALFIYMKAIKHARSENQMVGEKNDYYITIEQLEGIIKAYQDLNHKL